MSDAPSVVTCDCLPGYRFLKCLGRNPLAEVWKAEAPDGRLRAVKFVSGSLTRRSALGEQELRTVSRLQQMQHPALAAVEIVENDHGRLVLVTDLVEHTLRERYEHCLSYGLSGLARQELVGYLKTAAEALDYLEQQHLIQHLCLNPNFNLLIRDGAMVVSDFGLVQFLWIPSGQPLAQINPRYAAPELFEERLSRTCDQYSLALIYQEMRTGMLPHRANTTRQIMAARLEGSMNLDLLSSGDREVIGRALDRDPRQRFLNCTEMVQALIDATLERVDEPEQPPAHAHELVPVQSPARGGDLSRDQLEQLAAAADVKEVVGELVQSAASRAKVCEHRGLRYLLCEDGTLQHRCAAWLPTGVARHKLAGFIQQTRAQVVREEGDFFVFRLEQGHQLWRLLTLGKSQNLEIQIRLRPRPKPSKLTEVAVRMQYPGASPGKSEVTLSKFGPGLLESLHTHLLATTEHRVQERFPFEHPLRVAPVYVNEETGESIECQGKDISHNGIGFRAPQQLPTSMVYLYRTSTADTPPFVLPALVVWSQEVDKESFEVGARFLFERAPRDGKTAQT